MPRFIDDFGEAFANSFNRAYSVGANIFERMQELKEARKAKDEERAWQYSQKNLADIQAMKNRNAQANAGKILCKLMFDKGMIDEDQYDSYKSLFTNANEDTINAAMENLQKVITTKNNKKEIAKSDYERLMYDLGAGWDALNDRQKKMVIHRATGQGGSDASEKLTQTERDRAQLDATMAGYGIWWEDVSELPASLQPRIRDYAVSQYDAQNIARTLKIDPNEINQIAMTTLKKAQVEDSATFEGEFNKALAGMKDAAMRMGYQVEDPNKILSPYEKAAFYLESLRPKPKTTKKINLWENFGQNLKPKEDDFSDILNRR